VALRNEKEQGYRTPIDSRLGVNIEHFGGVDVESDPAAVVDGRFQSLINALLGTGPIKNRGGQSKTNLVAIGNIEGMIDASDVGASHEIELEPAPGGVLRLFWIGTGSADTIQHKTYDGATLDTLSGTLAPEGGSPTALLSLVSGPPKLYVGVPSYLSGSDYILPLLRWTDGSPPSGALVNVGTIVNLGAGAGKAQAVVSALARRFTRLYIGIGSQDTSLYATASVYSWDGATFTLEDTVTSPWTAAGETIYPILLIDGQRVYAFYAGLHAADPDGDYKIRLRNSAGVWSDLTLPAAMSNSLGHFIPTNCDIFNGLVYVAGFGQDDANPIGQFIFSSNAGSNFSLERKIPDSGITAGVDLRTFNGYLYYLWRKLSTTNLFLGRYDGATWDDNHIDFTAAFPAELPINGRGMEVYNGSLYISASGNLYKSNGVVTGSGWTKIGAVSGPQIAVPDLAARRHWLATYKA
jgi:hypothetical protein